MAEDKDGMIAAMNTDRELWRELPFDPFSPRVFVTKRGAIGMEVGGRVIVMPIEHWHALALKCT